MSNVKEFGIYGTLPFDAGGDDELLRMLGNFSLPTVNAKMTWSDRPTEMKPNEHGGKTAMYSFRLNGREAMSYAMFDHFFTLVARVGGTVTAKHIRDTEGG